MADTKKRTTKVPKGRHERNILTFYEKIAVIRYYTETNISRNRLAKMFHCCTTQIRRVLEKKDELLQQLETLSEADTSVIFEEMTRKRRKFEMSAVSFILHQWVERCRQLRLRKSITNHVLKETAGRMAAILNIPSFRPSYRWLHRFRTKYKYEDDDLGFSENATNTIMGELSVEDIIIEFKASLPSFMQNEISTITYSANNLEEKTSNSIEETVYLSSSNSECSAEQTEEICEKIIEDNTAVVIDDDDDDNDDKNDVESNIGGGCPDTARIIQKQNANIDIETTNLLKGVFPHLAVVHQFALMQSDMRALELISQLGVHIQSMAANGAYGLASNLNNIELNNTDNNSGEDSLIDLDDIVLIE